MPTRKLVFMTCLSAASAWRVPALANVQSRRGFTNAAAAAAFSVLALPQSPAQAKPSALADPSLSKEERIKLSLARADEEKVAALPINQMKASRAKLATATSLIDSGAWTELRDVIQATTGPNLSKLLKEGRYTSSASRELVIKMRKTLFDVDKFAYSQQSFPGSDAFSGYCAEGVVPRDEGGCKVKPVIDRAPLVAKVNDALMAFDSLIKSCGA